MYIQNMCIHVLDYNVYIYIYSHCFIYVNIYYMYTYIYVCTLRCIECLNFGSVILVLGNAQCIKLESLQKGTPLVQDQSEPRQKLVKRLNKTLCYTVLMDSL